MKKFLVVTAIALSCGAGCASKQVPMQNEAAPAATTQSATVSPDLSSAEAAVRSYVDAVAKSDLKKAALCVAGTHLEGKLPAGLEKWQQDMQRGKVGFKIKKVSMEITGDNALAAAQIEIRKPSLSRPQVTNQILHLHRAQDLWKIAISDPEAQMKSASDMNHLFAGLAAILIMPQMLDAAYARAHSSDKERAVSCRSNLRQLALATYELFEDNDEVFGLKGASLEKALMPYTHSKEPLTCPEDDAAQGGQKVSSYSFNSALEGVSMSKIKHPATTVMLYEGQGGKLNFRHNGGAAVAFADGRVRMVNKQEAESLSWTP